MPTDDTPQDHAFEFGPFRLMPKRRLLLKDGSPLSLGSRAMDLLLALVEHAGDVLGRRELESRAWPGLHVEETSLRVHMSTLRRTLQDGLSDARYITNLPGRGYCFVAPVARVQTPSSAAKRVSGVSGAVPALKLVFPAGTPVDVTEGVGPALHAVARSLTKLYRIDLAAREPSAVAEASGLVEIADELLATALRVLAASGPKDRPESESLRMGGGG